MSNAEQSKGDKKPRVTVEVPLEEPIVRGGETIKVVHLRKPHAGELRGLFLSDVANMKTDAIIVLLPRISSPTITQIEAEVMDPADLMRCALEVFSFLAPAELKDGQIA